MCPYSTTWAARCQGGGPLRDDDEPTGRARTMAPPVVARVRAAQPEPRAPEHAPPLGERELLEAQASLPDPARPGGDDELGALGDPGATVEPAIFQDEALRARAVPRPARQRRVVGRVPVIDQQRAAGSQRARHPSQHRLVLGGREVAEAG